MAERYLIATCPDMSWGHGETVVAGWLKTKLGNTAVALGLEPFEQFVEVSPPVVPHEFTYEPANEVCLMVTDEEYMLLKMKHSKWHECWKVTRARD